MKNVKLQEIVGGALQEQFEKSFEKVIENLQNPNTPYKNSREINIKLKFTQNEARDDVHCAVLVAEKLAPQSPMATAFSVGKDLRTGEVYAEEYGKQVKGQMSFNDMELKENNLESVEDKTVDTDTGEIVEESGVVDFRKFKVQ